MKNIALAVVAIATLSSGAFAAERSAGERNMDAFDISVTSPTAQVEALKVGNTEEVSDSYFQSPASSRD